MSARNDRDSSSHRNNTENGHRPRWRTFNAIRKTLQSSFRAGSGVLADGYDLFVVDVIVQILFHLHRDQMGPAQKAFAVALTYVGVILGMMFFGALCDLWTCKSVSLVTAALQLIGCISATCCMSSTRFGIGWQLGICRFVLGLGIGGEMPVSQRLSTEGKTNTENDPQEISILTQNQRLIMNPILFFLGVLVAPLVLLCLTGANASLECIWRVAMGIGIVPSIIAVTLRINMHKTDPPARDNVDVGNAEIVHGRQLGFRRLTSMPFDSLWTLLGCCIMWFLHNLIFFSLSSFKSSINERMFGQNWSSDDARIEHDAIFVLVCGICNFGGVLILLPFVDRIQHYQIVFGFFSILMVALFASGGLLVSENFPDWLILVLLYILSFFGSMGGGAMYLISAVPFPTEIRSTCFGIASAAGKAGALVGTAIFPILEEAISLGTVLCIWGALGFLGAVAAVVFAPKGQNIFQMFYGKPGGQSESGKGKMKLLSSAA